MSKDKVTKENELSNTGDQSVKENEMSSTKNQATEKVPSENGDTMDAANTSEEAVTEQTQSSENDVKASGEPLDQNSEKTGQKDNQVLEDAVPQKKKKKWTIFRVIRILCGIAFIVFLALFINEAVIEPYKIHKSLELTRSLYKKPTITPVLTVSPAPVVTDVPEATPSVPPTPTPDPNRDEQGRLLQFKDLLAKNEDVKGWITIPDTNIDYVVMQSSDEDPEYYLFKDINKEYLKAGSLFLDSNSSIEDNTKNLVIHGHNMTSTDNMFHYLMNFKKLDYYKERPVFTFDSIYQTGQWKIFAVFITNGTSKKEPFFDYTRSTFTDSSDFLNFIYQLRIRSMYQIDTVDVNENDQIITLSTCSYEVKNYRTVIVARRVREGEDPTVDVDSVSVNDAPLYPGTWYYRYGGKAPELSATFEEALDKDEIKWYLPPTSSGL